MSTNMTKQLSTPQFTFNVGHTRQPISAHEGVMASLSPRLESLINQAQNSTVELSDVDEEPFLHLVEYVYRGDYSIRPYSDDDVAGEDWQEANSSTKLSSNVAQGQTKPSLSSRRINCQYFVLSPREKAAPSFLVEPHLSHDVNHEALFLLHTKLHVLAERYCIHSLMKLTLQKSHDTLKNCATTKFVQDRARFADIVALANYAFTDTFGLRATALRWEVREYVVLVLSQIGSEQERRTLFGSLIPANPGFPVEMAVLAVNTTRSTVVTDEETVLYVPEPVTPQHKSVATGQTPFSPAGALEPPVHSPSTSESGTMTSGKRPSDPVAALATPIQTPSPPVQRPAGPGQTPGTLTRAGAQGRITSTLNSEAQLYHPKKPIGER